MLFDGQHDTALFPLSNGLARARGPYKEKHGSKNTRYGEQDRPTDPYVARAVVRTVVEIVKIEPPGHNAEDDRRWVRTRLRTCFQSDRDYSTVFHLFYAPACKHECVDETKAWRAADETKKITNPNSECQELNAGCCEEQERRADSDSSRQVLRFELRYAPTHHSTTRNPSATKPKLNRAADAV